MDSIEGKSACGKDLGGTGTGRGENVLNRFTGSSIGIQGVLGVPRALALFRGGTRWVVGGASG